MDAKGDIEMGYTDEEVQVYKDHIKQLKAWIEARDTVITDAEETMRVMQRKINSAMDNVNANQIEVIRVLSDAAALRDQYVDRHTSAAYKAMNEQCK